MLYIDDKSKAAAEALKAERAVSRAEKSDSNSQKLATIAEKADIDSNRAQLVGKIDVEKYRVVTEEIRTDEVIITDERIQHIKDHHPNDFERYAQYLQDIVENPQYILADKTPNTAVILKEYLLDDKRFRLILRLSTYSDPADYKNSIITFLEISERKFQKYLRNKKILYKSE